MDTNWPWDFWAAVGAVAAAAGAFATAAVAWFQIGALKRQQRGWETLRACDKYDTDSVINQALVKLRDVRDADELAKNPRPYRLEITIVMNYLEGMAIGIEQGMYDPRIVRDHLEPIIRDHVKEFLDRDMVKRLEMESDDFSRLKRLIESWDQKPTLYRTR